jgi:hypothetical protein
MKEKKRLKKREKKSFDEQTKSNEKATVEFPLFHI